MSTALIAFHFIVSATLIGLILVQSGKGADIGAAFGGASQTVFGGRGAATFLSKVTTVVAVLFLLTSISLAQMSKQGSVKSVLDTAPANQQNAPAQAIPAPAPAAEQNVPVEQGK